MGSFNQKLHNLPHNALHLLNMIFHQNSLCDPLIPEKFDSSHYNETDLFQKIESHGKIKNLYLIFSAFELGFGDAVADLDLAKIDRYYKDNVTSLGKKSSRGLQLTRALSGCLYDWSILKFLSFKML